MPAIEGIIEGAAEDFENAVDDAIGAIERLTNAAQKSEKRALGKMDSAISSMAKVASKAAKVVGTTLKKAFDIATKAVVAFGAGIAAATTATVLLARRGAKVSQIETSFDRLAGSAGVTRNIIDRLTQSTQGLISRTDLFASTNRLLAAQLPVSGGRFERLAEAAVKLARALGFSATEAVQRLSLGLSKQEPELLDEIGLKVDLTKALQDEAAARGVSMQALDAQTRLLVFFNAVEEQALRRSKELIDTQNEVGDSLSRIGVAFKNVIDTIATFVADSPALAELFNAIGRGIDTVRQFLDDNGPRISEALNVIFESVNAMGRAFAEQLGLSGQGFLDFVDSIITNRDAIIGAFERIGTKIGTFVDRVITWFTDDLGGAAGALQGTVQLISGALTFLGDTVTAAAKPIAGLITGFMNLIEFGKILGAALPLQVQLIAIVLGEITNKVTEFLRKTVDAIAEFNNLLRKIPGLDSFGAQVDAGLSHAQAALLRFQLTSERSLRSVSNSFKSRVGEIGSAIDRISHSGGQFNRIVDSIGGTGRSFRQGAGGVRTLAGSAGIPGFQTGGPVGADGLANLHAGEFVINPASAKALGPVLLNALNQARSNVSSTFNFNINAGGGMDVRELARLLYPELQRVNERLGRGG